MDIKQWYFLNYLDGKEAKVGEFLHPDGYAAIRWIGWRPDFNIHYNHPLIQFHLDEGIATYKDDEIAPDIIGENPHTETMPLKDIGNLHVERGLNAPDLTPATIGIPEVETTLKHYSPTITHEDSEKEVFDSRYPEYFSFTRNFMANARMGRWNKSSSLEQRITVDDTVSPEVSAPEDVTIGYNASLGVERTGVPSQSDDSPYTLNNWFEDREISDDGNFRKIERTFYSEDVRGNVGEDKQMITVDLNVGIEEAKAQKGFDVEPRYGTRGVNLKTFTTKEGSIYMEVFDMSGKLLIRKEFYSNQTNDFQIQKDDAFKSGTYIINAVFTDVNGNISVDRETFFVH